MDRTACTEPQCLYKGALYLYLYLYLYRDHMHEVTSSLLTVFYHMYENLNLKTSNIGIDLSLYPHY